MTEDHPTYNPDHLPHPGELTYRITDPAGSAIGVHFPPGRDAADLAARTRALVIEAFTRGNHGQRAPDTAFEDRTFEVLTQATLDHIQNLEYALEACRNAMLDVPLNTVPNEPRWVELLDAATAALGDDDTDH